jgi:phosphatidylglycerophosphate synthase
MVEVRKLGFVKNLRRFTDRLGLLLPLPNISPNIISGLSIVTSMLFLLAASFSRYAAFLFLFITLLLDWFDGIVARKHESASEEGYIVDVASDRFSEGLMFVHPAFFFPWFCFFTINCILAMVSVSKKRHVIAPLRHVFLLFYAFLFISG